MRSEEFTINCTALAEARETFDACLRAVLTKLAEGNNAEGSVSLRLNIAVQPYPDGSGLVPVFTYKVATNIPQKYAMSSQSRADRLQLRNGNWIIQDLQYTLFDEEGEADE